MEHPDSQWVGVFRDNTFVLSDSALSLSSHLGISLQSGLWEMLLFISPLKSGLYQHVYPAGGG